MHQLSMDGPNVNEEKLEKLDSIGSDIFFQLSTPMEDKF